MPHETEPIEQGRERLRLPWGQTDRTLPRLVLRPLQRFVRQETAGGVLLLAAAAAALLWANLWSESYLETWHTSLSLRLGPWVIAQDLQHWINDGLMALFFFVVGLEIKRELVTGELRDPRTAALPAVAALGGMVVPALLYLALNGGSDASRGWGIPMATDIAFAVGVLALFGRGLPSGLRVFLLSLAIVDDIGAILVIAIFYSGGISWVPLGIAAALVATIVGLLALQVRFMPLYVLLGVSLWLAIFQSGIHATIAGVILGFLTPAVPFQRPDVVSREARRIAEETADEPESADADAHHWLGLAAISRETISPLARLEHLLHPWTSYLIVPLFALANAGVDLRGGAIGEALSSRVTWGVVLGLVVGKTLGIGLFSWLAVRFGVARLPDGTGWDRIVGVAAVAGIGFTVSLFVAGLAFSDVESLSSAKVGILGGSVIAGALGAGILRAGAGSEEPTPRPDA